MDHLERLDIRTTKHSVFVSGQASHRPTPTMGIAAPLRDRGLAFELHLKAASDLNKLVALLVSPDPLQAALTCHGTLSDGNHYVTITALRSRYSTLAQPSADPHTGNVWLEYIDDVPRPDDVNLLNCYAATLLDLQRDDADRLALRLLDAVNDGITSLR